MEPHPVALVTGANQGIGLQVAKELTENGYTVLVGSRDLAKGENAANSIGAGAHALQLDVTDQASILAAAERDRRGVGCQTGCAGPRRLRHRGGVARR